MELRQPLAAVAVDQELRELEVGDDGSDAGLVLGRGVDRRRDRERGGEEDRRGEERNGTPPVSRNARTTTSATARGAGIDRGWRPQFAFPG